MPTTRKQKKARKSRGIEMLSDIENLDIMLGENHFNRSEGDESLNSNCACCNLALRLKKYLSTKLNCFLAYYTSFLMVDHLRLSGRYLNKRTSITNVVDSL